MPRTDYRLLLALTLSLTLHILPFLSQITPNAETQQKSRPIKAELRAEPPPESPLPLMVNEAEIPKPVKNTAKPVQPKISNSAPSKTQSWQSEVKQQLQKMDERGQFYPAEAIAQGLQGEVLILLMLSENGQVSAARVEESSGYPLLDNAALRAVRALHSLPADAPRETVLPVRFRLR